jgi:succinate dehydrogenase hydrophobic anchor subunit
MSVRSAQPQAPPRAAGGSRAVAYLVVRVTGVLLAVLVLGHFALTHVFNDVADTGSAFVGRRWASAFWLAWDWLMLGAAFAHGGAGAWVITDDYTRDPEARRWRRRLIVVTCGALWVLGSVLVAVAL